MSIPIKINLIIQEPIKIHLEKGQAPFDEHDRKHSVTSQDDHLFPEGDHGDEFLRKDGEWATPPGGSGTDHNRQHDVTSSDDHQMNTGVILGRTSVNRGAPEELTASIARDLLNIEEGATAAGAAGDHHAITTHAPADAQKNVQSDWNQSNQESDDYIKNKPTSIPPSEHTHDAGDITSGTFDPGLIPDLETSKIPGLGNAATKNVGTGSDEVAAGDHTHSDLHSRLHSVTSQDDHLFPEGDHGDEFLRKDGEWQLPSGTDFFQNLDNILISGGIVTWTGQGYTYHVTPATARILGARVKTLQAITELAAPDASFNRIDIIAINAEGLVLSIQGTPASSPVKPQVNSEDQIELTQILVETGTTEPSYMTGDILYDENEAGEWVASTVLTGTASVNFADTSNPFRGTKAINTLNLGHLNDVVFTKPEGAFDLTSFETISFWLKLKAPFIRGYSLYLIFHNGSTPAGIGYLNIDREATQYQQIALPTYKLNLHGQADKVILRIYKTGEKLPFTGFFIDNFKLEKGIITPQPFTPPPTPILIEGLILYQAQWVVGTIFKEYHLSHTKITAEDSVEIIPENQDHELVLNAEILPETTSGINSVVICANNLPAGDIRVSLIITKVQKWQ